jgi:conjugative transposon TraN protein
MKAHILIAALVVSLLTATKISAQDQSTQLQITFNKTSSVVFPETIMSVDRGSADILAQKANGVDNVLQIKGGRVKFHASNITVITSEGRLYEFEVIYAENPSTLTLSVNDAGKLVQSENSSVIFREDFSKSQLESVGQAIVVLDRNARIKSVTSYNVSLDLASVYVKNNTLLFHVRLRNESGLNYDLESFRLYVRDKEKMKRTASQEVEVTPIQMTGNQASVRAISSNDLVLAVNKFTIPDAKRFVIEITEKNGGRHLLLQVKNKTIVSAKQIQ